ncbi:MAG: hypothetical protein QM756_11575 [Polyangiaceae bacterium]
MEFGRRWLVETNAGWVEIRRLQVGKRPESDAAAVAQQRLARLELIANPSLASLLALRELWSLLRASPDERPLVERPAPHAEWLELERMLDDELNAGLLELALFPHFRDSLQERTEHEPPPPPLRTLPPPEPETSFIAVRLIDQSGKPVVGREWSIELPDGSLHEGVTDFDGWARVQGFVQDGSAKVCFPAFDELDSVTRSAAERLIIPVEGGDPDERFIELTFVRPSGEPISGVRFSVTCKDGTVFKSKTDQDGFAMLFGLTSDSAVVKVQRRAVNAS